MATTETEAAKDPFEKRRFLSLLLPWFLPRMILPVFHPVILRVLTNSQSVSEMHG